MPIYLCQPGSSSNEPWRHGVQVYERPFPLRDPPGKAPTKDSDLDRPSPPPPLPSTVLRAAIEAAEGLGGSDGSRNGGPRQVVVVIASDDPPEVGGDVVRRCLAASGEGDLALVFCAGGGDAHAEELGREGFRCASLRADATGDEQARILEGFGRGQSNVLVVDDDAEEIVRSHLAAADLPVRTVINADLCGVSARAYLSRLRLASDAAVTLFRANDDAQRAKEFVDILKGCGQAVPRELAALAPPPPPAASLPRNTRGPADPGRGRSPDGRGGAASSRSSSEGSGRDDHAPKGPPFRRSPAVGGRNGGAARPNPVRRVRHAEVVLADQCVVAHGRTWLRLRWPGEQGGFGGFVALSRVVDDNFGEAGLEDGGFVRKLSGRGTAPSTPTEGGGAVLCQEVNSSTSTPPPAVADTSLLCKETGTCYPTSKAMKLLMEYDDGLGEVCTEALGDGSEDLLRNDLSEESSDSGEPVFCRICREGLHDVNYDMDTTPQQQQTAEGQGSLAAAVGNAAASNDANAVGVNKNTALPPHSAAQQSFDDLPPLVVRHPTAENPLLSPCDCTGSMAFVHYLCVEQWRCRSRHPGARDGRNCETCGAAYTLPPPPSRPARGGEGGAPPGGGGGNVMAEDDWLDAMPPHVLAALRRPHPAWQLGAAAVRRRWLRPAVPVVVSPLVALYCRARRTLKKRGVSRRRWACSLCRRRARWKCVRCLRSYYCSRQCQNVSWHIVHKHVCYKPVRFWWSVVVYTMGICMTVPGIVENFPIYDAMVTLLPVNFVALGIVFGGVASALKRSSGVDIRGRILEVVVVLQTLFLTGVTSGLVRGYFGDAARCWGVLAPSRSAEAGAEGDDGGEEGHDGGGGAYGEGEEGYIVGPAFPEGGGPFPIPLLNAVLVDVPLRQIQGWYLKWDYVLSRLGPVSRRFLCRPGADGDVDYPAIGCSPPTRAIDPRFHLDPGGEGRCTADLALVMTVWFAALGVLAMGKVYRRVRGAGRRGGDVGNGAHHRGRRRPHQD